MKRYYPVLAIALLVCLLPMPYGYYVLIRFVSAIAFGMMAYEYYHQKQKKLYVVTLGLTLLFQPLVKIPLGREVWNLVDVLCAVFLLYLFWRKKRT
ncbi:DUF6804 family protein [uncultured Bacteroides sp.]|uniref:DUF6804 family protein n=1 Tax=uncultured Bacteroides sp. TaxID=162156 RepID=UPI002614BE70|nr:DUF6804 family protein [uncultured Bacteroides sp.]